MTIGYEITLSIDSKKTFYVLKCLIECELTNFFDFATDSTHLFTCLGTHLTAHRENNRA